MKVSFFAMIFRIRVPSNTSKTVPISRIKTLYTSPTRVAEQLKTSELRKLVNIRKKSKLGRRRAVWPVSFSEVKIW